MEGFAAFIGWLSTMAMALLGLATTPRLAIRLLRRWNRDLIDVVEARRVRAKLLGDLDYWRRYALKLEVKIRKLEDEVAGKCSHGYLATECPRGCRLQRPADPKSGAGDR